MFLPPGLWQYPWCPQSGIADILVQGLDKSLQLWTESLACSKPPWLAHDVSWWHFHLLQEKVSNCYSHLLFLVLWGGLTSPAQMFCHTVPPALTCYCNEPVLQLWFSRRNRHLPFPHRSLRQGELTPFIGEKFKLRVLTLWVVVPVDYEYHALSCISIFAEDT